MIALLLGVLLVVPAPDTTDNLDACLSMGPDRVPPPITTLDEAQQLWLDDESVSRDTLRAHLSRIQNARQCFLRLDPSAIAHSYTHNILETYEAEAELHAALRQFPQAFGAYEDGLSYLQSDVSRNSADYESTQADFVHFFYQQKGYLHYLLGNLSASIEQYLHAIEAASTPSEQIDHLISVGVVLQNTQDYRSARHYYRRAQRRVQTEDLPAEQQTDLLAYVYQVQADLLLEQTLNTEFDRGALKRARTLARKGRRLAEPGTERYAVTSALLSESLGYLENFDAAYRLNDQVRRYARAEGDARLLTSSLLKLGVLHLQTGRWEQAGSSLHRALTQAEALGDLDDQRRILRALGRLHELQNNWPEAERYYRKGVHVVEDYRESLTATQWSSTAFAQWRDVHRGLVRTLLAQGRPRDALAALDRSRARYLQDLRTQAQVANELPASDRTRLDSVSRALSDVRTQIGTDTLSSADEAALRNREATLMTARQQILGRGSTIIDRPSIEQIAASLDQRDRALVSYFLDDPWPVYDRSPQSAAFILTADTLRVLSLPGLSQDSVRARVTDISPLFAQTRAPNSINAMHFDLRPLRTLHDQLYAPIAPHLPDGQPLTVIPDGPMFHVPYSMLATSTPGGRYDHTQARFLLHERPTALDLSTSMAADTSAVSFDPNTFAPTLAAFGVSTFDTLRAVPSALRATLPEDAADSSLALSPLPGVQSELSALDRLLGDAKTFLGDSATESTFMRTSRRAGVVHLASHAFVHPSSPLQNAFLLRPDSTSDGLLFLHELRTQDRTIPLAVLSGCGTARGTLRGGEGMAGLQYAFRAMGAQSTVSNLWPTADQSSVTLMEAFYENLRAGLPKDRALRQAKLAHLEAHPDKASPFFWGAPVLYGSPQPVPMERRDTGAFWSWTSIALAGLAVLLVLLLLSLTTLSRSFRRFVSS